MAARIDIRHLERQIAIERGLHLFVVVRHAVLANRTDEFVEVLVNAGRDVWVERSGTLGVSLRGRRPILSPRIPQTTAPSGRTKKEITW